MKRYRSSAFTLIELLVTVAAFSALGLALISFTWTATRLAARNFATNHSHESVMSSEQRMLNDLHSSASPIQLVTFNGTTYTDAVPTVTTDLDPFSHQYLSTRANALRFWRPAGGPFKLTADTARTTTTLTFDFSSGGAVTYVPRVGDKLLMPLIAREFLITAVPTTPTSGSPTGKVTINAPGGIDIQLSTAGTNVTTAYFFRQVGYSAINGRLRYHNTFPPPTENEPDTVLVRDDVTSPKPFAILYDPARPAGVDSDKQDLHVSLEFYDSSYTARQFLNGTTTLQSVISIRNQPAPVNVTQ